eukprot:4517142-Pyramimonas_sp.AAC.1
MIIRRRSMTTRRRRRRKRKAVTCNTCRFHYLRNSHGTRFGRLGVALAFCEAVLGIPWGPIGPSWGRLQ